MCYSSDQDRWGKLMIILKIQQTVCGVIAVVVISNLLELLHIEFGLSISAWFGFL